MVWQVWRDAQVKKCPVSSKRKYHSKLDALLANADKPLMARAYLCPHCDMWHLTKHVQGGIYGEGSQI